MISPKLNSRYWIVVQTFLILLPIKLFAQSSESKVTAINIHVNVLTQINIKQAKDIQLVINADSSNTINIDPRNDINAGRFEAEGTGAASIKISFPGILNLREVGGDYTIPFHIIVASYSEDEQWNSELLETNSVSLKMDENGQRYFWVGGRADIGDAPGGKYVATMSFNLEYD